MQIRRTRAQFALAWIANPTANKNRPDRLSSYFRIFNCSIAGSRRATAIKYHRAAHVLCVYNYDLVRGAADCVRFYAPRVRCVPCGIHLLFACVRTCAYVGDVVTVQRIDVTTEASRTSSTVGAKYRVIKSTRSNNNDDVSARICAVIQNMGRQSSQSSVLVGCEPHLVRSP